MYEVLPLCISGPAKLCINISRQTWAFALLPKEDFRTLLRLFTALSLSVNHVYITETLGKELGNEQNTMQCLLVRGRAESQRAPEFEQKPAPFVPIELL